MKINLFSGKMKSMVIKASKSQGLVCEARSLRSDRSEFKLSVNPTSADIKADLILKTETTLPIPESSPFGIIQGSGEFEIVGVKVRGIGLEKEADEKKLRTIYIVEMDGLQLCFLGSIQKDLDEGFLEKIGEVDVLFVNGDAEVKKTLSLIKDIDPRVVVCHSDKDAKLLGKELGQSVEQLDKAVIKRKDLEEEETKLIWITEK